MQLPRLKEWRESRGLLQKELASEAGLSEFTINRIETGDNIRPNTARKVADALGVTVADLMESPPVPLAQAPDAQPEPTGAKPPETIVPLEAHEVRSSLGDVRVEVRERLERALQLVDAGQIEAAAEEVEAVRRLLAA